MQGPVQASPPDTLARSHIPFTPIQLSSQSLDFTMNSNTWSCDQSQQIITRDAFGNARPTLAAGVVEIAALTTLIGSSTAESLVLGSRGASGVLWASMGVFGAFAVIKGAVTAATPNWLRETLGVRSAAVEQVIGSAFNLSWKTSHHDLGQALAIQSVMKRDTSSRSENEFETESQSVVYAFNRLTAKCFSSVRAGGKGTGDIYIYHADPYRHRWMKSMLWADFYGVLFSMCKLFEIIAFYKLGATSLAWLTGGSWAIALLSATLLILLGLSQDEDLRGPQTDLLVGELPTPTAAGGYKGIILGVPAFTRQSIVWVLVWAIVAATNIATLLLHYIVLGKLEPMDFYAWGGFQLLWLVGRMSFFHYSGKHTNLKFTLVQRDWKRLNPSNKNRIRNLAYGLSKHLINVHPRKPYCYEEDATAIPDLGTVVENYPITGDGPQTQVKTHLASVVGDTMLGSACWVYGAEPPLSGTALYDACIIQFVVEEKIVSVPVSRSLAGPRPKTLVDEEDGLEPSFPSKGGANIGPDAVYWVYWVPYGPGRWLQMKSKNRKILGDQTADVVTDEQITATLQTGDLFISLREVGDVMETVRAAREACGVVKQLLA